MTRAVAPQKTRKTGAPKTARRYPPPGGGGGPGKQGLTINDRRPMIDDQ